jgi:hypothetical protein
MKGATQPDTKVDALGTFSPNIDLQGNLAISFRPNPTFSTNLNLPGTFSGTILNREHIGKTSDELVRRWNEEHPDDPVAFSAN